MSGRPLSEVLDEVAARSPAPGGGSVSAWAAAFAAALVEMSAAFAPREELASVAAQARASREHLMHLADAELTAYAPVLQALRLPASDPTREERRRAAMSAAAQTPLEIARASAKVAALAAEASATGSRHLVGDALAASEIAKASCRAAARLVEINLVDAGGSTGSGEDPRVAEVRQLTSQLRDVAAPHL